MNGTVALKTHTHTRTQYYLWTLADYYADDAGSDQVARPPRSATSLHTRDYSTDPTCTGKAPIMFNVLVILQEAERTQ
jgi:hypothetical protein